MIKRIFICLGLFSSVLIFGQTDTTYKPVDFPDGYISRLNVTYVKVKEWEGKLDLYLPPLTKSPSGIVINIHGGGWKNGIKESQTGFSSFFKAGFAVANISYRLTGQATAPAAIEDVRCALIYVIQNAKSLNIDVNKIVIMGGSAGGHLALMGGLLGNDKRFDTNCPCIENIYVAAIIDKYGITDVWDWAYGIHKTSKSATQWLGDKSKDEAFAKSVSPINYVSKSSPQVLIIHGDADPTVPYEQSVLLYKKLMETGVKSEFITVKGGLHGKFDKEKNSELNKSIMKFIAELD